jgi:transketolase
MQPLCCFRKFLKFDPADPTWADRDRFVLSAGHGSMLLYSLLHLTGYKSVSRDDIRNFRQLGATTAGHPETSTRRHRDHDRPAGSGLRQCCRHGHGRASC